MTAKILKVIGVCIGFFIFYSVGFLLGSLEEERLTNKRLGGMQIPFRGDHPSTSGSSDGTSPEYIHHSDFTDYFNEHQYDILPYQEPVWHKVISVTTKNDTVYCGSVTLKKSFLRKELTTKFILKLYTDDELILLTPSLNRKGSRVRSWNDKWRDYCQKATLSQYDLLP